MKIEETHNSPYIHLSIEECKFEIIGNSFSEQADTWFKDILKWIDENLPRLECNLTCLFNLNVFNSITYRNILSMLQKFEDLIKNGRIISVDWCYDSEDEDNLELANDLKELFDIPFKVLKK